VVDVAADDVGDGRAGRQRLASLRSGEDSDWRSMRVAS